MLLLAVGSLRMERVKIALKNWCRSLQCEGDETTFEEGSSHLGKCQVIRINILELIFERASSYTSSCSSKCPVGNRSANFRTLVWYDRSANWITRSSNQRPVSRDEVSERRWEEREGNEAERKERRMFYRLW
jgi:hypothetical protein